MRRNLLSKILILSIFIFSFLFIANYSLAQCATNCPTCPSPQDCYESPAGCEWDSLEWKCKKVAGCESPPPSCNCGGSRTETEYRCESTDCGAIIQKQTRICSWGCSWEKTCTCTDNAWDCGNCIPGSKTCEDWSEPQVIETCEDWQKCGSTEWNSTKNTCQCAGECLEIPENDRYYDSPNYPTDPFNPEESLEDTNNIFLPVKLDWDDVFCWYEQPGHEDGAHSYRIRIENTTKGTFEKPLDKSEFIPAEEPDPCLLKSNATHQWKVVPCCNSNGTNCKSWNDVDAWSFKTNLAPEPIEPADPDWQETEKAENLLLPITLDWCDVSEAQSYLLKIHLIENEEEVCHPWLTTPEGCRVEIIKRERRPPPYPSEEVLRSEFVDKEGFFTKDTEYKWKTATCLRTDGVNCSEFGQKWRFETAIQPLPEFKLLSPSNDPQGKKAVGLPIILNWGDKPGINSYIYEVNPRGITDITSSSQTNFDYPVLSLNALYSWKIKPCWDYEGKECENYFVGPWYFKTTGAPPNLIYPENNASDIIIPVKLNWEDISGAASYKYQVSTNSSFSNLVANGVAENSGVSVDYPNLKMLTRYFWRIKTCAHEKGEACGAWSSPKNFKTFKLSTPSNPQPEDNSAISTAEKIITISWQSVLGARSYQYKIKYLSLTPEEKSGDCPLLVGKEIIDKIVSSNSDFLSLKCLGEYQWQVKACLDKECRETGDWSNWRFNFIQPTEVAETAKAGLVPCGRIIDDPNTPWNERDPCQPKHLFILLRNILDLLLWKVAPIILVLLVVGTGVMYYFSLGSLWMIVRAKSMLRGAVIGYLVIFFAWSIVNLILAILGYQIGIFGRWWEIKF